MNKSLVSPGISIFARNPSNVSCLLLLIHLNHFQIFNVEVYIVISLSF
uniref:Uncharacterized protein n=1 Tax=Nelumbo nucifera TaxID=4432 RepID=A0A822Y2Q0_NELNU|nr:TPA_asm: hypothetical protein HUJ06_027711 [Nelumbo nucifera]